MKIVFGLGNPGVKYRTHRHNIGQMVLDLWAQNEKRRFKRSFKIPAHIAVVESEKEPVYLVKPRTFMNNSGVCVKKTIAVFDIEEENCLVVYDDVDLPLGTIRFREKGSSGGHRGLAAIIEKLGTEQINRLRIGIGRPEEDDVTDFVLSPFLSHEGKIVEEVLSQAEGACKDWVKRGSSFVMEVYNRKNRSTLHQNEGAEE